MNSLNLLLCTGTLFFLSLANTFAAGDFQPSDGATITEPNFSVSWNSNAPQQWVRAFNADTDEKFFDSDRLRGSTGSLTIQIPEGISSFYVLFYEQVEGNWENQKSTYVVSLDDGDKNPDQDGPVIVSDRVSCSGELLDQVEFESTVIASCELSCPEGEILIAAVCNSGIEMVFSGDEFVTSVFYQPYQTQLRYYSNSSGASCTALDILTPVLGSPDLETFELSASGACMSLPNQ